jgi:tellurite resistance protein
MLGAGLGLTGLALAWQRAISAEIFAFGSTMSWLFETGLPLLAAVITGALVAGYGLKIVRHRPAFLADLRDPGLSPNLGTVPMCLMLLPAACGAGSQPGGSGLWLLGAALHLGLAAWMSKWLVRGQPRGLALTPAWFVPMAGMFVGPTAGLPLGYDAVSTALFAIGCVSWLVLLPIILRVLVRYPRIPVTMLPSLFVLAAPPALVSLGLAQFGVAPALQLGLAALACMTALAVGTYTCMRAGDAVRAGFSPRWWGMTFPLAAVASAALAQHAAHPDWPGTGMLGLLLLITATLAVVCVGAASLAWIIQRQP